MKVFDRGFLKIFLSYVIAFSIASNAIAANGITSVYNYSNFRYDIPEKLVQKITVYTEDGRTVKVSSVAQLVSYIQKNGSNFKLSYEQTSAKGYDLKVRYIPKSILRDQQQTFSKTVKEHISPTVKTPRQLQKSINKQFPAKTNTAVLLQHADDSIQIQNITTKQARIALDKRFQNPDKYNSEEVTLVSLKKEAIAEAVAKRDIIERPFEIIQSKQDKDVYYYVLDRATGKKYAFMRSNPNDINQVSPENLTTWQALQLGMKKASLKGAMIDAIGVPNEKNNVKFYGQTFAFETIPFFVGLGANHMLNLFKDYEKNPMALEHFFKSLEDPVTYISFYFFMVGNRWASSVFKTMIERSRSKATRGTLGFGAGFLAMAVGSMASDLSSDLWTITKPCADAFYNPEKEENNTPEKRWEKCQSGWNAIVKSDTAARYLTSVGTIIPAAFTSSLIQSIYRDPKTGKYSEALLGKMANKVLPVQGISLILAKLDTNALINAAFKGMRFLGRSGIKAFDLILFLQADELIRPSVFYTVESKLNSGLKLGLAKNNVTTLIKNLDNRSWLDETDGELQKRQEACARAKANITNKFNNKDFVESYVQRDIELCGKYQNLEALSNLHEKYAGWRQTLSYDFTTSYNNWMQFLTEFNAMEDGGKMFVEHAVNNVYSAEKIAKMRYKDIYNPLSSDNALYGVLLSTEHPPELKDNFDSETLSRISRVEESIQIMDKGLSSLENLRNTVGNGRVFKGTDASSVTNYEKEIAKVKDLIALYETRIKAVPKSAPENYHLFAEALTIINNLYKTYYVSNVSGAVEKDIAPISMAPMAWRVFNERQKVIMAKNIKEIRDYIGDPKPLKRGYEGFAAVYNDKLTAEKSEFVDLFKEKGSPADTLIWYSVCGAEVSNPFTSIFKSGFDGKSPSILKDNFDDKSAMYNAKYEVDPATPPEAERLDQRRTSLWGIMDSAVNGVAKGWNSITDWLPEKLGGKNDVRISDDNHPFTHMASAIRYGTGVNFNFPKIVKGDTSKICRLLPPIAPGTAAGFMGPDNKKYDSLYSYLVENIRPDVFNLSPIEAGSFLDTNTWWKSAIEPKVDKAYAEFNNEYLALYNDVYRKIFSGGTVLQNGMNVTYDNIFPKDPSPKVIDYIAQKTVRETYGNPTNIIQAYMDELTIYLGILERIYVQSMQAAMNEGEDHDINFILSQNGYRGLTKKQVVDKNIKLFKDNLDLVKAIVTVILNDTRISGTPTAKQPNKLLANYTNDQKYALLLLQLQNVYASLGLDSKFVSVIFDKSSFIQNLAPMDQFSPLQKIALRLNNDKLIQKDFVKFAQQQEYLVESKNYETAPPYKYEETPFIEMAAPLTYSINDKNFVPILEYVSLQPSIVNIDISHMKYKDMATTSFLAGNRLFDLAEEIYMSSTFIKAASVDQTYKKLQDNGPQTKGTGITSH